jgi:hypothetical protein
VRLPLDWHSIKPPAARHSPERSCRPAQPCMQRAESVAGTTSTPVICSAGRTLVGVAGNHRRLLAQQSPPLPPACVCSGMSSEDIDAAVLECKRDMFSMRIKFAKREVGAGRSCAEIRRRHTALRHFVELHCTPALSLLPACYCTLRCVPYSAPALHARCCTHFAAPTLLHPLCLLYVVLSAGCCTHRHAAPTMLYCLLCVL